MLVQKNLIIIFYCNIYLHLGARCVNPETPDTSHNLELSWNPKFPPKIGEFVQYK